MTHPTHATWNVISQLQKTDVGPTGQLVQGYEVTFATGSGHVGSVFVPNAKYTPDTVREMIQDQADLMDAVGSLSSDTTAG